TFIDQELVIVEGDDFADARASGEQIGVLMSDVAGKDVDRNDAQQFGGALVGVLSQSVLHDAREGAAVGGDCQTFHAFIGHATGGVAGYFDRAHRRQGV